jgi:predicted phage tail protein
MTALGGNNNDGTIFKLDLAINNVNESKSTLKVYPNPNNGIINIIGEKLGQVELLNVQGQIIKTFSITDENATIDISELLNGIYLLKIQTKNGYTVKKIIKQ